MAQELWDLSTDKTRATGPPELKLTFSERQFKELSEIVHLYLPLIYSC